MFRAKESSFVEKCVRGEAKVEEIDEYVERWHRRSTDENIATFLGMSDEEYSYWLRDPDVLPYIVTARAKKITLDKVINDNYSDEIGLSAADNTVLTRLKRWIGKHDG